jgi:hypothetical protein
MQYKKREVVIMKDSEIFLASFVAHIINRIWERITNTPPK